ncbi:MAG: DUF4258 domain-containing protein, partial [Phycisphaerales bacterium]
PPSPPSPPVPAMTAEGNFHALHGQCGLATVAPPIMPKLTPRKETHVADWPDWWQYDVVISPHVVERMGERGFTEIDLRGMLEDATDYRESVMPGRFVLTTTHNRDSWEVVVEPDDMNTILVVVTAYKLES